MALSVLNNIASLAAQNQLTITNGNLQKALFQLSSGSRINTGADDAAGLAIADGLHANITALTQSARNANDGVGELQVADGSLAAVTTLLNRAITIATEASTGTVSDPQRIALNDEFTAIKSEIDRVGSKTNYNGGQVFTANTLNVFLSDSGSTSNSLIGVTTGLLSSTGLSLGGATAATGLLTQAAPTAAVAATDNIAFGAHVIVGGVAATGTLTSVNTQAVANGETVTVGGTQYTFQTTLTSGGTANQVLIGLDNQSAFNNLAAAINGQAGGAGTLYGIGTVANTQATATQTTAAAGTGVNVDTIKATINGIGNATAGATGTGNSLQLLTGTVGTITVSGAAATGGIAGDTVTVGGKTYTFATIASGLSTTPQANEVLLGASNTATVANLVAAINQGTQTVTNGVGSKYSASTVQNAFVTAVVDATVTTIDFTANTAGSTGNNLTGSVVTAGGYAFTTGNFTGGVDLGAAKNAVAGDTVTIGSGGVGNAAETFHFVSALSTTPTLNEVLVGADEAHSLDNLANAVNGGAGLGTTYSSNTVANTAVLASTGTNVAGFDTLTLTATTKGLAGNTINTQATGGNNTFGAVTLTNGSASSSNDLLNIADATAALTTINAAIQTVAALRGSIGATVNRLQSAAGVITNQVQNLTGAEDGVRAADIPSTVATLAKYSILEQTGISSLAQANQQQQLVLKLLQ